MGHREPKIKLKTHEKLIYNYIIDIEIIVITNFESIFCVLICKNQSRYRPGGAQRVLGS